MIKFTSKKSVIHSNFKKVNLITNNISSRVALGKILSINKKNLIINIIKGANMIIKQILIDDII